VDQNTPKLVLNSEFTVKISGAEAISFILKNDSKAFGFGFNNVCLTFQLKKSKDKSAMGQIHRETHLQNPQFSVKIFLKLFLEDTSLF
jgi:hypothetical protein